MIDPLQSNGTLSFAIDELLAFGAQQDGVMGLGIDGLPGSGCVIKPLEVGRFRRFRVDAAIELGVAGEGSAATEVVVGGVLAEELAVEVDFDPTLGGGGLADEGEGPDAVSGGT